MLDPVSEVTWEPAGPQNSGPRMPAATLIIKGDQRMVYMPVKEKSPNLNEDAQSTCCLVTQGTADQTPRPDRVAGLEANSQL